MEVEVTLFVSCVSRPYAGQDVDSAAVAEPTKTSMAATATAGRKRRMDVRT
jgi:hypothetical protein